MERVPLKEEGGHEKTEKTVWLTYKYHSMFKKEEGRRTAAIAVLILFLCCRLMGIL